MPIKKRVVEVKISKIKELIQRIENMDFTYEQFFDGNEPYQDVLVLGKNKYLSAQTAEAMAKAVGFRNIAIHDYDDEKFDIKEVYRDYKDDIRDMKKFCAEVVSFLEKH